jgi:5-methylcytosine-specific restriction endonuclease McrA
MIHAKFLQVAAYTRFAGMGRALVLNTSHQPLAVVTARRAVVLVLKEKAEVLASDGQVFHSEHVSMDAPSVLRLRRFVRVPYRAQAPLTRRAVFARDHWTCQYCGAPAENLDHVVPKSRGGSHTWDNVVAACRRCNHTKADRSLAEMGWALPHPPRTPSGAAWRLLGTRTVDPRWREWLGVPESVSA